MRCAVKNCGNDNRRWRKKWRFFHFPKDQPLLQIWVDFCEREDTMNTGTACICNEHFKPDDFERNLQYELGFTRKNPTILKPASFPTMNAPQGLSIHLSIESHAAEARKEPALTKILLSADQFSHESTSACSDDSSEKTYARKVAVKTKRKQGFKKSSTCILQTDLTKRSECDSDAEITFNETEEGETFKEVDSSSEASENPYGIMEVEIVDPLNPNTNAEDNVEIIGSEYDTYVKHLEIEVCTLKQEVSLLKNERKQLLDEIGNLQATIRNSRLQSQSTTQQFKTSVKEGKVAKSSNRCNPVVKKTVILFTANIETIRKLRQNNSTD